MFSLAAIAGALCLLLVLVGEAAAERQHTVRSGQTLARIARRYRVSLWDLQAANRIRRNGRIRAGQVLTIPDRGVIYVRPGDTLSRVARREHVSESELRQANKLRRRSTLRVRQRLFLPGYSPRERLDRDWGTPDAPGLVRLRSRHGERVSIQLVDSEGRVRGEGLDALGQVMRRHEDDAPRRPNPRLALLLARLSDQFGGRTITLQSGFREVGGYTRESSRHTQGRASDIRIQGVPNRTLWEACRRIDHAGCGYYPRSTFVHVDARRARTQWVDWSRPGRRPRYGTLRGPANRRRRRRMRRARATSDLPLQIEIVDTAGAVSAFDDTEAREEDLDEVESDACEPPECTPDEEDDEGEGQAESGATDDAVAGRESDDAEPASDEDHVEDDDDEGAE